MIPELEFTKKDHDHPKLKLAAEFLWQFYAKFADDEARDALLAVNQVIRQVSWQPIETAPKDGTRILACNKAGEVEIVKWDEGRHSSNGYMWNPGWLIYIDSSNGVNNCYGLRDATHWMPLPEPPQ